MQVAEAVQLVDALAQRVDEVSRRALDALVDGALRRQRVRLGLPAGSIFCISDSTLKPVVSMLAMLLAMMSISRRSTIWRERPTERAVSINSGPGECDVSVLTVCKLRAN